MNDDMQSSPTVLVGVLKNPRDLAILENDLWYRIPLASAPKRPYDYVAFYQPAAFGQEGKRIAYFGPISRREVVRRIDLLPDETHHPRAHDPYLKITLEHLVTLPHPIRNIIPRRLTFGFTTLKRLLESHELLKLFGIPPTEQMVASALAQRGIPVTPEYTINQNKQRYRVDLAIFCQKGNIAIECDNRRAHRSPTQRARDRRKDAWLRRRGWRVIRLKEHQIIEHLDLCLEWIEGSIDTLGGTVPNLIVD